jgi:hypothetical protein
MAAKRKDKTMYSLPYDLHAHWAAEGAPVMSDWQEAEEERWHSVLDGADHILIMPEAYTERDVMVMIDRINELIFDDSVPWSQDLRDRATILEQLLEEVVL